MLGLKSGHMENAGLKSFVLYGWVFPVDLKLRDYTRKQIPHTSRKKRGWVRDDTFWWTGHLEDGAESNRGRAEARPYKAHELSASTDKDHMRELKPAARKTRGSLA